MKKYVTLLQNILFGRRTVSNVMSAFNKTITSLKQVEMEWSAEAKRQEQIANQAAAKRRAAQDEAEEAKLIAEQFTRLATAQRRDSVRTVNALA